MGKENKSRYALLGMLSLGSMSGYDLKKTIEQSLGNFWHESYPQIYPMLKQLEQEGLTTGTVERQEGRPDRHVYTLTEQGWDELKRWLGEPYELQYERNELLLKLFFGSLKPTEISIGHVQRHRDIQEGLLAQYEQIEAAIVAEHKGNPNLPYWLLTLHYGLYISRALLAWCDEALTVLAGIKEKEREGEGT